MNKKLVKAIIPLCIFILFISFFIQNHNDKYKNDGSTIVSSDTSTVLPANPIDFEAIQAENPDVCAWIQIPGIDTIDYPILRSSADMDDNYYLNHDIHKNQAFAGAIYIQKLNHKDFSDSNTLIYGHDMLNGTMFGKLRKFRDKEFFDKFRK